MPRIRVKSPPDSSNTEMPCSIFSSFWASVIPSTQPENSMAEPLPPMIRLLLLTKTATAAGARLTVLLSSHFT